MNKTVNGRYEDKKSVSLRLFLVLCIFLYRSSGRKYLFTCGSGSSRVFGRWGIPYVTEIHFQPRTSYRHWNRNIPHLPNTLLGRQTGFIPSIMIGSETADVRLKTVTSLPDEAYNLIVTSEKILIESAGDAGFFYALQSLRQLLPIQDKQPMKSSYEPASLFRE